MSAPARRRPPSPMRRRFVAAAGAVPLAITAGCAGQKPASVAATAPAATPARTPVPIPPDAALLLDRITWGASPSSLRQFAELGESRFIAAQLRPQPPARLPPDVDRQIAELTQVHRPLVDLVQDLERQRRAADALANDDEKQAARVAYQQALTRVSREAGTRTMLLAVYSPEQLREQMTWFWVNHFNVFAGKANLRVMVGDYEDRAIRPHALGRFRDLLGATTRHPAMLRYLDNEQNAANRINENHARELLELHTLGVSGGYTQADVQELARVMTGVGNNFTNITPRLAPAREALYVRDGGFEFNPNRHDFGDKRLLGRTIRGRGLAELDEVLDLLARHPSTATFVCGKLARFLVGDAPDPALVARMAATFTRTDGDIAAVLEDLFSTPAFRASLGTKFKDPVHYVVSAVRLAYDDRPILNAAPMLGWLGRLGQQLYARQTPDGYPLDEASWSSSGQMTTRFEVARAIGAGSPALFRPEGQPPPERPVTPSLQNIVYVQSTQPRLAPPTRKALDQAGSPQEWNAFLLSSPEFMRR